MLDVTLANGLIILVFAIGYFAIIFEYNIRVNKTASALLMAVVTWMFLFLIRGHEHAHDVSLSQISELKTHLRQVLTGPTILGSQLGGEIIKYSASAGIGLVVRKYGGLRKFAHEHLRELVSLKLPHGPGQAETYDVLVPSSGVISTLPETRVPVAINHKSKGFLWSVVSNPFSKFVLEKKDGELFCAVREIAHTSSTNSLPSLTPDEYKTIVSSFAESLKSPEKESALEIIKKSHAAILHRAWTHYLYSQCLPQVGANWQRHRVSKD